jgi:hypothetical protein
MSEAHRASWTPERRAAQAERMRAVSAAFDGERRAAAAVKTRARRRSDGGRYSMPQHSHPIVRGLFIALNADSRGVQTIATEVGVSHHTILGWRDEYAPTLPAIDATLNALGLELAIVRRGRRDDYGFSARPLELSERKE